MTTNATKNPYIAAKGLKGFNNYPISGYGITIETVKHFLFENNLEQRIDTLDNASTDQINNILNKHDFGAYDFGYYQGANIESEYLIYFPTIFDTQEDSQQRKVIPTKTELDQIIIKVITLLYGIPTSLQEKLRGFISRYAYYIEDYNFDFS